MIELFGTDKQKSLFLKKLYTGQWGGTMDLTEPEAGSDVGALTTSARRLDDGTYAITGNKIYITNGEHDLTENIIHPVLARIEGAPAGTKGISIFIVPKIWVNDDGSPGEVNDIVCTGTEEKMGIARQRHLRHVHGQQRGVPGAAIGRRKFRHENHVPHDERGSAGCWLHGILQCHGGLSLRGKFCPGAYPGEGFGRRQEC
jgi:hypothetical protein